MSADTITTNFMDSAEALRGSRGEVVDDDLAQIGDEFLSLEKLPWLADANTDEYSQVVRVSFYNDEKHQQEDLVVADVSEATEALKAEVPDDDSKTVGRISDGFFKSLKTFDATLPQAKISQVAGLDDIFVYEHSPDRVVFFKSLSPEGASEKSYAIVARGDASTGAKIADLLDLETKDEIELRENVELTEEPGPQQVIPKKLFPHLAGDFTADSTIIGSTDTSKTPVIFVDISSADRVTKERTDEARGKGKEFDRGFKRLKPKVFALINDPKTPSRVVNAELGFNSGALKMQGTGPNAIRYYFLPTRSASGEHMIVFWQAATHKRQDADIY